MLLTKANAIAAFLAELKLKFIVLIINEIDQILVLKPNLQYGSAVNRDLKNY